MASAAQSLGAANSFSALGSSYTNTVAGTSLTGDLGYTTGPAVAPTVIGTVYTGGSTYSQAGIDQANALTSLNAQPCTHTFPAGPVDLATDTSHGPVAVYTPGVYCASGAATIGGGGTITLNGTGLFLFRMDGALTTTANSIVTLSGASACDVWWTPRQATTLGANSTFAGSVLDASGITVGDTVTWNGQALAFGGTVSTTRDTIIDPTCPAARSNTPALPTVTPGLPNTGGSNTSGLGWLGGTMSMLAAASAIYLIRSKRYLF